MKQRPPSLSIVPSLGTPPTTPRELFGLLVASSAAVGGALTFCLLLGAPLALSLPGVSPSAVLRLAAAQLSVGAVALVVIARGTVKDLLPLYRALSRGPRTRPHGPPLSQVAVQAAFAAPESAVLRITLLTQLPALVDAVGLAPITGLSDWPRLVLDLASIGVSSAGLHPSILLWQRYVWRWLGRLHPTDVTLPVSRTLGRRTAFMVGVPVVGVGVMASVVLVASLFAFAGADLRAPSRAWFEPIALLASLAVAAGAAALAWLLGRRLGAKLAADVRELTREIHGLRRRSVPGTDEELRVFRSIPHTPAGVRLGDALADLAARFSKMREKEQQARFAMEQVRKLKTQFLASMSHDLRSPLNSIVGFADLLSREADGPLTAEQQESVQMIRRSARELLQLVTNILDSARLEAGKLELRRAWTPSVEILTQAVAEGRHLIAETPLKIEAELQPGLPPVYVDADRAVQAVIGLFSHAVHAMDSGTIRLVARVAYGPPGPEEYLRVDVLDEGAGIREADQERIFEAFRELQEPSGRRIGGLGLGLALARDLVQAHGGDIWFESEPGKGTTFSVALPLAGPPTEG